MSILEVIPGKLYQCSRLESTNDYQRFLDNGVKAIIDVDGIINPVDAKVQYYLSWLMGSEAPPLEQLDIVSAFAVNCIKNGFPVLVHGGEGINRTTLVCARVYMFLEGKKGVEAVEYMRQRNFGSLTNQSLITFLKVL